jgi:hypothetical protein
MPLRFSAMTASLAGGFKRQFLRTSDLTETKEGRHATRAALPA